METIICEKDFYYKYYIKNQLVKCEIIFSKGRSYKYEYGTDEYIDRILVFLEYSQSYYPFSKNEFDKYFMQLKEIRKLKLEKLNENRR